jgi:hypothetical protein
MTLPKIRISKAFSHIFCLSLLAQPAAADDTQAELPLIFREDFENGFHRWKLSDPQGWIHRKIDTNHVFGIKSRTNAYKPQVRSPHHIALIKGIKVSDFVLTFRVRSTKDTGNHRDCCVFFNHQDATHFYYVHLGAKPDPHSGQIMIVDGAPRKALTNNKKSVPWDDQWHQVKVTRDGKTGLIQIYFDDMQAPLMATVDKTFDQGQIGLGSFDDMNDFDDIELRGR